MDQINNQITRFYVASRMRLTPRRSIAMRDERGAVTAEYGTVALVAVALALAVLGLFTTGKLDDVLHSLMSSVLKQATSMTSGK